MTDELAEMLGLRQGPVQPRRGDLERVVGEQVANLERDALAEIEPDAVGMVDVEPQRLTGRGSTAISSTLGSSSAMVAAIWSSVGSM